MAKFNRIKAPKYFLVTDNSDILLDEEKNANHRIEDEGDNNTEMEKASKSSRHVHSLIDVLKQPVLLRILVINIFCWYVS